MRGILFICLLTFGSFSVCIAAENAPAVQAIHWYPQLMQDIQNAWPKAGVNMSGPIKFVVGNNIWQPGRQYKNGSNWLALVCNDKACSFVPASLTVSNEQWQGHYDDEPTFGQRLLFSERTASGNVIAWFHTLSAPKWVKPGIVPTYYRESGRAKAQTDKGTLEFTINLPGAETAKLIPMLLTAEQSAGLSALYIPEQPRTASAFYLQLRSKGKRQMLHGELGSCSHTIKRDYLLWSGDADGDGKADYMISFVDEDGPVHLYLSGAAKSGQIVGLAGVHLAPPFGGECDGSGWM